MTQGQCSALIAHLFLFVLVISVAGCGSSGGETPPPPPIAGTPPPPAPQLPPPNIPSVLVENIFADPGNIVHVPVGDVATLDGSGSTTSAGLPLEFAWSFTHKPDGSKAELLDVTSVSPSFVTDVRGTYMVQLIVTVDGISSQPVIAAVEATNTYSASIPAPNHTASTFNPKSKPCVDCHIGGPGEIVGKSPDHIASSNTCQACHSIFGFSAVPFVDHQEVFGNCSGCHDGVIACTWRRLPNVMIATSPPVFYSWSRTAAIIIAKLPTIADSATTPSWP